MAKKLLKIGDRFSYSDGYGYVIKVDIAILFEPKTGSSKFVLEDKIPKDARFMTNCPLAVNLAMDVLDLIINVKKPETEEELNTKLELVEL